MRRASLPKPVRDGLAIGALILVIAALVGFAGAPRVLAVSGPTPDLVAVSSTSDDRAPLDDANPELPRWPWVWQQHLDAEGPIRATSFVACGAEHNRIGSVTSRTGIGGIVRYPHA